MWITDSVDPDHNQMAWIIMAFKTLNSGLILQTFTHACTFHTTENESPVGFLGLPVNDSQFSVQCSPFIIHLIIHTNLDTIWSCYGYHFFTMKFYKGIIGK